MARNRARKLCCLCGTLSTEGNPITREHVPPKQFYPEPLRKNVNLWVVPTCESCNRDYKSHEEYFLHAFCPLVLESASAVAADVLNDLKRRARKSQTPRLIRKIARGSHKTTTGGLLLPSGIRELRIEQYRIEQVAIKIARCLYFRDYSRILPRENCKDIRICTSEDEVPDMYRCSWERNKDSVFDLRPAHADTGIVIADGRSGAPKAVLSNVFSYRESLDEDNYYRRYSLLFWGAVMFCMTFEEPIPTSTKDIL